MRVTLCVDALQPQLSGIGRYTWELCNGLARRPEISQLQFYSGHSLVKDPSALLRQERSSARIGRLRRAAGKWYTRRALKRLVHGPNYFLPLSVHGGVVTVHDLSVTLYPEMHPADRVRAFERLFTSSLDRAAQVITDTETVRQELIAAFSLPSERVSVAPLGVDQRFRPREAAELRASLQSWGLQPGSYGLSVAAFEPRKKIAELIEAWRRLPSATRTRFPLVLAGARGWRNEPLHVGIERAQAEGWLKHLGFVDEDLLPQLYAGARLFVYPSIYEGFGLPPVEAMASGTPVIVSNRSCLPEVCGDAARFIDPDDADGFTGALDESLNDERWGAEMVIKGLDRAKIYTWESCVADTVAVYRKTLAVVD